MAVPLVSNSTSSSFTQVSTILKTIESGPGSVNKLGDILKTFSAKSPYIVTGNSIATKTPICDQVIDILNKSGYSKVGRDRVFHGIGQHSPIQDIKACVSKIREFDEENDPVDLVIAIGGGSPIDAAKTVLTIIKEETGRLVKLVSLPTTLSAAEMTIFAGYTDETGVKRLSGGPAFGNSAIIFDAELSLHTPPKLWLSTGIRALDHSIEQQIRKGQTLPVKIMAREAAGILFESLRATSKNPKDLEARQRSFCGVMCSLWPTELQTKMGLSHTLGYEIGAPFSVPHGYCSAMTLSVVLDTCADHFSGQELAQLAAVLPFVIEEAGIRDLTNNRNAVKRLGLAVQELVDEIGVSAKLSDYDIPQKDLPGMVQRALSAVERDTQGPLAEALLENIKKKLYDV